MKYFHFKMKSLDMDFIGDGFFRIQKGELEGHMAFDLLIGNFATNPAGLLLRGYAYGENTLFYFSETIDESCFLNVVYEIHTEDQETAIFEVDRLATKDEIYCFLEQYPKIVELHLKD